MLRDTAERRSGVDEDNETNGSGPINRTVGDESLSNARPAATIVYGPVSELGYGVGSVRCLEDNSSVVLQAGGDSQAAKSSHYRRDQAYIDEYVNAGKMYVDKVDTKLNVADLGTKAVSNLGLFEDLRDRLTGYNPECYMSPRVEKAVKRVLCLLVK